MIREWWNVLRLWNMASHTRAYCCECQEERNKTSHSHSGSPQSPSALPRDTMACPIITRRISAATPPNWATSSSICTPGLISPASARSSQRSGQAACGALLRARVVFRQNLPDVRFSGFTPLEIYPCVMRVYRRVYFQVAVVAVVKWPIYPFTRYTRLKCVPIIGRNSRTGPCPVDHGSGACGYFPNLPRGTIPGISGISGISCETRGGQGAALLLLLLYS